MTTTIKHKQRWDQVSPEVNPFEPLKPDDITCMMLLRAWVKGRQQLHAASPTADIERTRTYIEELLEWLRVFGVPSTKANFSKMFLDECMREGAIGSESHREKVELGVKGIRRLLKSWDESSPQSRLFGGFIRWAADPQVEKEVVDIVREVGGEVAVVQLRTRT